MVWPTVHETSELVSVRNHSGFMSVWFYIQKYKVVWNMTRNISTFYEKNTLRLPKDSVDMIVNLIFSPQSILEKMDDIPSCQEKAREQATHVSKFNLSQFAYHARQLEGGVCFEPEHVQHGEQDEALRNCLHHWPSF